MALRRARSHLRGAELLARKRQFALAYSILVLSFEELAKALTLKLAADKIISFDSKDKGTDRYLDPRNLYRGQGSHVVKQTIAVTTIWQLVAFARVVQFFAKVSGRQPTEKEEEQILVGIVFPRVAPPDLTPGEELKRRLGQVRMELAALWEDLPKLDPLKQKGFYTDLAPYSGKTAEIRPPGAKNYHRLRRSTVLLTEVVTEIVTSSSLRPEYERMVAVRRMRDFGFTHA